MTRRAFVTGASGFVGGWIVRELIQQGWQVTALVRATSLLDDLPSSGFELHFGDITEPESLQGAIAQNTDCVFHTAASTSVWSANNAQQARINIDGTRNVLEAAKKANVKRLVYTSSFTVWGQQNRKIDETSTRYDGSDWVNYIRTKHAAEQIIKAAADAGEIDATILSPAHILGPGDRHNWSRIIRLIYLNKLPGVPPGGGAFADVREIARAHVNAFEHGKTGASYLLGGPDTMFIDVVHEIGKILDRKVPGHTVPGLVLKLMGKLYGAVAMITGKEPKLTPEGAEFVIRHIQVDSTRARNELGYRFTPVDKLLEDTCQWMKIKEMLQ
jgi:dihydroflavonol-4-reductase